MLFLGCRKYLLRNLYHDLLNVAKNDAVDIGDEGDELMELPQPTTGSIRPRHEPGSHFHPTLARTIFSVCFGESIVLFTLLMFQGLDIMNAGYALLIRVKRALCSNRQVEDSTLAILPHHHTIEHHCLYTSVFQSRVDV